MKRLAPTLMLLALPVHGEELRVTGSVLDASGFPASGALVTLIAVDYDEVDVELAAVTTSYRGTFETTVDLGSVPRDRRTTSIRANLCARAELGDAAGRVWRPLRDDVRSVELDVRLVRGRTLRGVVLDDAGEPVAGATVVATRLEEPEPGEPRVTRALPSEPDGCYSIHLPPGEYALLASSLDHVNTSARVTVRAGSRPEAPELRMTAYRSVRGHLRAGGGEPLAGVRLTARLPGREHATLGRPGYTSFQVSAVTDEQGAFELDRMVPGTYTVGGPCFEWESEPVVSTDTSTIELTAARTPIDVTILDVDGEPLEVASDREVAGISLHPVVLAGDEWIPIADRVAPAHAGGSRLWSPPGRYGVFAYDARRRSSTTVHRALAIVEVQEGSGPLELSVKLEREPLPALLARHVLEPGALRVRIETGKSEDEDKDNGGEDHDGGDLVFGKRYRLFVAGPGDRVARQVSEGDSREREILDLPPGRTAVILVVEGGGALHAIGSPTGPIPFLVREDSREVGRLVTISSGEVTEVVFDL